MAHSNTQRVLLAGIGDARLDLFLLLNEGAGYEVVGVVAPEGNRESSRIAEILGVRVFDHEHMDTLPETDLLIYGAPEYRALGSRLRLSPEDVWHEDHAWDTLIADGQAGDAPVSTPPPQPEPERAEAPAPAKPAPREPIPMPLPARTNAPVPEGEWGMVGALARAGRDLHSLYEWILSVGLEHTGAAAGGIAPDEPVRPYVFRDRRQLADGELPAFLRAEVGEGVTRVRVGDKNAPGSATLALVAASDAEGLDGFVDAVAPALRTAAELDDLRRERAWDGVTRRLVTDLSDAASPAEALTAACRSLAELLAADECVLLFRSEDGEVLRGFSSFGHRIVVPAESGWLAGGQDLKRARRLVDSESRWHFHVPFGEGARTGVLALYGVTGSAGSLESVSHQATSLARALADRFPDSAWRA